MKKIKVCFQLLSILIFVLLFDAVKADTPLWARMLSPKYRNAFYPTMQKPSLIKIRTKLDLPSTDLATASIEVRLARNATTQKTWTFTNLAEFNILDLPVADIDFDYTRSGPYVIDDNPYFITLELKNNNVVLDAETLELHNYPPPPSGVNEVRIDDNNNILVNGEPTFLFGAYLLTHDNKNYDDLVSYGFTSARSTSNDYENLTFLVGAHIYANDLTALRNTLRANREASQTVAWYIADEPNEGNVPANALKEVYKVLREEDPYHPGGWAGVLLTQPGDYERENLPDYEGCQDFIAIDAYPCYPNFTYLKNVTRNFQRLHDPTLGGSSFEFIDLPTWGIPQMFEGGSWRWPLPHEEKNMVYQYIANGAKSLFPYSYRGTNLPMWDYWRDTLIPDLKAIEPAIFAPMYSGTSLPEYAFPNTWGAIQTSHPDILVWSYRRSHNKEYLFLVNTSSQWNIPLDSRVPGPKDVTISVDLTFNLAGSSTVNVLTSDWGLPQSYTLTSDRLSVQLPGVNEDFTGVLVLEREIEEQNPSALAANILLSDPSPSGAGTHTITLVTSKTVIKVPTPLVFTENDGSTTQIELTGQVPGTVFTGTFIVDENVAEGQGEFSLPPGALQDEAGATTNTISSGGVIEIDRTAPMQPTGLLIMYKP